MENEGNVDELLNTLRIPAIPPNRSQWKKLEIAVKFINKSKNSAQETRTRKESLKIDPKEPELFETASSVKSSKPESTVTFKMKKKESENLDKVQKNTDGQGSKKSQKNVPRKDSKWSKIRSSLHQVM